MHRNTHSQNRIIRALLYTGMALTVFATLLFPLIDRATTTFLADHIQQTYPGYDPAEVGNAVTAYLVILSIVGVLGIGGWYLTIRAMRSGTGWTRWVATGLLAVAVLIVSYALTARDTSGELGLAPLMGWLQVLPLLPGVAAVVLLWRGEARG
ncbi:MAG TPA: hypothetical protein VKZ61_09520 [Thermomicrobiales bacterium]|jgi:hypothetical protein|nr:hypothetical protein [Thermomicrobiales bacterium]